MHAYLSVHKNVYDGVVHVAALGQIHGDGGNDGVNVQTGVNDDGERHGSVWKPGHQEGQHHHHHHTCHLDLHAIGAASLRHLQLGHLGHQKQSDNNVVRVSLTSSSLSALCCLYLAEGPQQPRVRHHDDRERHGKAKGKVHNDVGHVPTVSAVPVGGAGGLYALQRITAPTKQGWSVPHKGPDPGEQHSSHCVSAEKRWVTFWWTELLFQVKVLKVPGLEQDCTHGIAHHNVALDRNDSYCTQARYT